jgi:hypothetical protein
MIITEHWGDMQSALERGVGASIWYYSVVAYYIIIQYAYRRFFTFLGLACELLHSEHVLLWRTMEGNDARMSLVGAQQCFTCL